MTTNDGGWMLAAKIMSGSASQWTHDSEKWTVSGNHFNESDFNLTTGESKYMSFDEIELSEILVVDPNGEIKFSGDEW